MGSEQPIHIKTSAHCSASDSEDNNEMKVRHNGASICLCPGVAQGAWKHAPIIPLPNYYALIMHTHHFLGFTSKLPLVSVLVG